MRETVGLLLKGGGIGVAMIIPGVSGGTMALVLGVYERLISALNKIGAQTIRAGLPPYPEGPLKKWRDELKRIDFYFLCRLSGGALIVCIALARLMAIILGNYHDPTYGFFWGLILASIIVPLRMLERFTWRELTALLLALTLTASLSYAAGSRSVGQARRKAKITVTEHTAPAAIPAADKLEHSPERLFYLFICGALAISAMILPGISGSFVLLMLGVYFEVLAAVNQRDLLVLAVLGAGMVTGLLGFTRVLNWAFKRYHNGLVAFLIGLMIGSLYGVWPFRHSELVAGQRIYALPKLPELDGNFALTIVACLAGIAIILALTWTGSRVQKGKLHTKH